jgi:hypothetical protein
LFTAVLVGAFIPCVALPSIASADSGSITNVRVVGNGVVEATYSSTSTYCTSIGFCGWYPTAVQRAANQACTPYVDGDGTLTYVGDYHDSSGTEVATETFYPKGTSGRICLYLNQGGDRKALIAEYGYDFSPPPPAPEPESDVIGPLTVSEARSLVPQVLRRKYPNKFRRASLTRSCYRYTAKKVRCRVAWRNRPYKYSGYVTLWNDPDDAAYFRYVTSIRRTRLRPIRRRPVAAPVNCQGYNPCLAPGADVDCAGGSGNGPRYVNGPVSVSGSDPYDLDRDGDGVACE